MLGRDDPSSAKANPSGRMATATPAPRAIGSARVAGSDPPSASTTPSPATSPATMFFTPRKRATLSEPGER